MYPMQYDNACSRTYPIIYDGVLDFLGYRIFYHYNLLNKSNLRTLENRLWEFKELYDKNEISYEKVMQSLESWMAYARYADSHNTRKEIIKQFNSAFKADKIRPISRTP